jgi:mRNA-degrading endonuclease toxin of MazEF toxin-antitoxin module
MYHHYIPQGSIFMVNLEPVIGHEQGRTRPVIVVSIPDFYNLTGLVLARPMNYP